MPRGLPLDRPTRLKVEEERLRALPSFKFQLLDFNHDGSAQGVILDAGCSHPIRIEFGTDYPFQRPSLWSDEDEVKALPHVNRAGEICTLRTQPDDWDPDRLAAADLVELAWKLIVNKGDIEASEDDAIPEPIDFQQEQWSTLLLAPEDAHGGASQHGTALLLATDSPTPRVLLTGLTGAAGQQEWRLDEATARRYLPWSTASKVQVPWFQAAEPPPFSLESFADLERIMLSGVSFVSLARFSDAGKSIAQKATGVIKLLVHYTDETGLRWALVEVAAFRNRGGHLKPTGAPKYMKTLTIGDDAFFGRIDGLLDRHRLQDAHIALIGVGAIGSRVAALLNQAGVGRITAFDRDAVEAGNPVRGLLPFTHIGLRKTESVGATLSTHLPTTRFTGVYDFTWTPSGRQELERLLREEAVDLVVVAIGNHNGSRYLDKVLEGFEVPRLYTWTTRGAAAGVVLTIDPRDDRAALRSYEDYHRREAASELPQLPEVSEEQVPNVLERGCAAPALPATPLDIATVALHASRTAIDLLLDRPVAPYQYWTQDDRAWFNFGFEDPEVRSQCIDGRGTGNADRVDLSSAALDAILHHADASPDAETGGVLAGFLERETLRIEYASGPGERSKRTLNRLVLDKQYAQGCIDAVATLSHGKLRYTGEWHTHPSGDLSPSPDDLQSLRTLASSREAAIEAPLIIIAGQGGGEPLGLRAFTLRSGSVVELSVVPDNNHNAPAHEAHLTQ